MELIEKYLSEAKFKVGDKALYGTVDPKKMGFPLNKDDIGIVTKIYQNRGVTYLKVEYKKGKKPMSYPESEFVKM